MPDYSFLNPRDLEIRTLDASDTVPSVWYTDLRFFQLEQELLFSKFWQYAGYADQVARPGEYFLATIAENPVLVCRDEAGKLRAFYNVCRHRGGPLATEDGTCKVFQCRYHGWTYKLDGSLRGVPEFDRVQLFDKKDFGLIPVHVAEWQGLIFVSLDDSPRPVDLYVEGIVERIAPMKLSSKRFYKRVVYDLACNWKVYVDNYLEGYHLPFVHPELSKLLDYRQYTTEDFEWYSLQYSPFSGSDNLYQQTDGEAYYYFVFPNFMLNILPGRLQTNVITPLGQERCRVQFDYYYDKLDDPKTRKMAEEDIRYSDEIQQEDITICEQVQRGLRSRAYDRGRFSVKRELGVYHFQTLLKKQFATVLAK